ncbi:MAG: phage tail protein [Deltaproteobacteria bacterium]|nr:phage tail protein [Deltaproteobacteria bacterium]
MADDKQLGNYRFLIEIEGVNAGYFKSMSGLASKQDMIEYRFGGDRSIRRKPGRISFTNLVLEMGYTVETALFDWRKEVGEGDYEKRDGSVIILDHDGSEQVRYNFYKAWPVSWEAPALVAGAGETAVEKLELAVEWVELG